MSDEHLRVAKEGVHWTRVGAYVALASLLVSCIMLVLTLSPIPSQDFHVVAPDAVLNDKRSKPTFDENPMPASNTQSDLSTSVPIELGPTPSFKPRSGRLAKAMSISNLEAGKPPAAKRSIDPESQPRQPVVEMEYEGH